jgi:hypothetical protein
MATGTLARTPVGQATEARNEGSPETMKRALVALAALAALGALTAFAPFDSSPSGAPPPPRRQGPVLMYGDSLLESAAPYVRSTDQVRALGGTALCDWVDNIAQAAAVEQPSVMVVEFVGNDLTKCMDGYNTPGQVRAKYNADATALKERVDVPILWVGPPLFRSGPSPTRGLFDTEPLFVDAGDAVMAEGAYTDSLPCLPDEGRARGCSAGDRISVRAQDGVHFGTTGSSYLSGARRFADAIDEAVSDQR